MMWKDLMALEPKEPPEPRRPSEYGIHRTSKHNTEEVILYQRILLSEARYENLQEGGEDEDFDDEDGNKVLCKPEDWDYDTRIDLSMLLKKLPKGVDPKSVYLNLNRPRAYDSLTIDLVYEKPRDMKKEGAAHKKAMTAWKIVHDKWKVDHDAWTAIVSDRKIEATERNLERMRAGTQLDKEEVRTINGNVGMASEENSHRWAAEQYAERTGCTAASAREAVDDFIAAKP